MTNAGPTGKELVDLSRDRDLISKRLFIMRTFVDEGGSIGAVLENLDEHLAYWDRMENEKVMFAAGPNLPADASEKWAGDGLVVIRAESYQEAQKIADADPMHESGARTYELRPWLLNHLETSALTA